MAGKIYQVKYRMNGQVTGARYNDRASAENAAASLKRNGYKGVRIVSKSVR